MAAFEVIALDTATPQLRAPGASDTYTFPRAVEMPLGTANGVLYLNGSKVVSSGSALTFDGTSVFASPRVRLNDANRLDWGDQGEWIVGDNSGAMLFGVDVSEKMRLTSTGLGIGTNNPGVKLEVSNAGDVYMRLTGNIASGNVAGVQFQRNGGSVVNAQISAVTEIANDYGVLRFATAGASGLAERARIDSSGNLGLGVTPSAWGALNAVQVPGGSVAGFNISGNRQINIVNNSFFDGANYLYIAADPASRYLQVNGQHAWFIAPSGTAGNAISFTQAMVLDASGNLGIGTTSPGANLQIGAATSGSQVVALAYSAASAGTIDFRANGSAFGAAWIQHDAASGAVRFATAGNERLRLKSTGQLRFIPLASDPAGAENGDVYYNSGTNKLRLYAAGAWVDLN